jgi:hypothetical protein
LERLVAALGELDDRARAEPHHFAQHQLALGELDDDGHLQAQDALELTAARAGGGCALRSP